MGQQPIFKIQALQVCVSYILFELFHINLVYYCENERNSTLENKREPDFVILWGFSRDVDLPVKAATEVTEYLADNTEKVLAGLIVLFL